MLNNSDPDAPNGGRQILLRLSENDSEKLEQVCERTDLNASDALRAAIGVCHRCLVDADDQLIQALGAVLGKDSQERL